MVKHRKHLLDHILISIWVYMRICIDVCVCVYIYKANEVIIKIILLWENICIFLFVGLDSTNILDPISLINMYLTAPFCQQMFSGLWCYCDAVKRHHGDVCGGPTPHSTCATVLPPAGGRTNLAGWGNGCGQGFLSRQKTKNSNGDTFIRNIRCFCSKHWLSSLGFCCLSRQWKKSSSGCCLRISPRRKDFSIFWWGTMCQNTVSQSFGAVLLQSQWLVILLLPEKPLQSCWKRLLPVHLVGRWWRLYSDWGTILHNRSTGQERTSPNSWHCHHERFCSSPSSPWLLHYGSSEAKFCLK